MYRVSILRRIHIGLSVFWNICWFPCKYSRYLFITSLAIFIYEIDFFYVKATGPLIITVFLRCPVSDILYCRYYYLCTIRPAMIVRCSADVSAALWMLEIKEKRTIKGNVSLQAFSHNLTLSGIIRRLPFTIHCRKAWIEIDAFAFLKNSASYFFVHIFRQ